MPMYHFRLPDGQEHATHKSPTALRKQYPDAVIIGRVDFDAAGNSTLKPYSGEQPTGEVEDGESVEIHAMAGGKSAEHRNAGQGAAHRSDKATEKVAEKDARADERATEKAARKGDKATE